MPNISHINEFLKLIKPAFHPGEVDLTLKGHTIDCAIDFLEINKGFMSNIILEDCVFLQPVTFPKRITYIRCSNVIFECGLEVNNTVFKGKSRFYNCHFKGLIRFTNAKFDDLIDFWASQFHSSLNFFKTDFNQIAVFPQVIFHQNILFSYSSFSRKVIFDRTIFHKGLDLSTTIFDGDLNIFEIEINTFKTESINNNTENATGPLKLTISAREMRETFRILKHHLDKLGNQIDALKYFAYEQSTHMSELWLDFARRKGFWKRLNSIIILLLNWSSNNFKQSWLRSLLFTFGVGGLLFYFMVLSTDDYEMSSSVIMSNKEQNMMIENFFKFLLPTHKFDVIESMNPNISTYILDVLGRLFVGYGIYQMIQAFRKYK